MSPHEPDYLPPPPRARRRARPGETVDANVAFDELLNQEPDPPHLRTVPDVSEGRVHDDHLVEEQHRCTDVGNARRLVTMFGHQIRWVPAHGAWLVWDGVRWHRDELGELVEMAKAVGRSLWDEAVALTEGDRKKAIRWAEQSEGAMRIEAMVRLARSEPGIAVTPDQLDADPWLLNVSNGTVDLRSGVLRDHDPGRLITKLAPVDYDPGARCTFWERTLKTVLPDEDVRRYLQRVIGYAITGKVDESILLILHGLGANGKTTVVRALQTMLGSYARQASTDVLLAVDAHPTGVADLQGARFVVASEADDGRRLAEGTVKALTGGDRLKARFMRQDFFEFEPTHTIFLCTNHRPIIRGTDHGIWRRVKLIPFTVTIPVENQDKALGEKIDQERSGILNWALAGCLEWQQDGLVDPEAVRAAGDDYRAEMDVIGTFIADVCIEHPDARVGAAEIYRAYTDWCDDSGERAMTQRRLGAALTERGFDRKKDGPNRRWHWFGVGLGVNP